MDFDPHAGVTCERLSRELLPPIFVAHRTGSAAPSGDVHAELRRRFARGRMVALDPRDLRLVEIARDAGAPANYAGSGGAVVGLVPAGRREDLRAAFASEGCETLFPA
jgi:hypothetical protein